MKTHRKEGNNQYTISIPHTIQQILHEKRLYITRDKTPGMFHIHPHPTNQEHEKQRSIFPNGKQKYFTLPIQFMEDIQPEHINRATFLVDLEHLETISLTIA